MSGSWRLEKISRVRPRTRVATTKASPGAFTRSPSPSTARSVERTMWLMSKIERL